MINKKLDDILKDIEDLKRIFNSKEYFKKLEENIERENQRNMLLEKVLKYIQQQYEDTYTLISLPATKEKKKEYEIRCKVYEDILDKLKGDE